ncbi:hypothetical protein [Gottfriedia solisilvae]|uniref:Uncharacterized protein n=1 Tax=Gottfriedia solisilvae TaxID=1516104 RepID=A0A8J3EWW4_9BACI|nr:hypothetical protein [Gottfriedia solisilvae]GGI11024.1 hypothetical protein GCM10007380_05750 [Gottfriedia solisilvae]
MFVVGAQGIIRGIILGVIDRKFEYQFILPFIPNQYALIANIVLLLISFVIFAKTKPFENEKNN